jgi:hypothetical protein
MITMSESSREFFFLQLFSAAPAIDQLLKTYPSRIRGQITTGDAVNGYGVSVAFQVFIDVLMDRCRSCGETQFSAPNFDYCRGHRFKTEWREIASGEGVGTQEALNRADKHVAEWLERVDGSARNRQTKGVSA